MKDCKVVLEDISPIRDAEKLKILNTSQRNTHTTSSYLTKEERLLVCLSIKTAIAWGKTNDKCWAKLKDIVSSKLKNCNTVTEQLEILQNVVCN